MADYILTEAEVSNDEVHNAEDIDQATKEGMEFINNDGDDDEDVNFSQEVNEKLLLNDLEEKVPVPVVKHNVRKLKKESDSEKKYEEDDEYDNFVAPNSENVQFPENTKIIISKAMLSVYGTGKYEWNHYKPPTGKVFDFPNKEVFMRRFLDTLFMATKNNECVNSFLPFSQNYVGKFEYPHETVDNPLAGENDSNKIKQSKDWLHLNLLYALRHTATSECSHTTGFSCLDEDMLLELKGI